MHRDHVFISYARGDSTVREKIQQTLEQAGIHCWVDTQDITPGEKWMSGIEDALKQSRAMIVLWSTEAQDSDYIEREFHGAEELNLPIIPVITEGHKIPLRFKDRSVIFLSDGWQS